MGGGSCAALACSPPSGRPRHRRLFGTVWGSWKAHRHLQVSYHQYRRRGAAHRRAYWRRLSGSRPRFRPYDLQRICAIDPRAIAPRSAMPRRRLLRLVSAILDRAAGVPLERASGEPVISRRVRLADAQRRTTRILMSVGSITAKTRSTSARDQRHAVHRRDAGAAHLFMVAAPACDRGHCGSTCRRRRGAATAARSGRSILTVKLRSHARARDDPVSASSCPPRSMRPPRRQGHAHFLAGDKASLRRK